MLNETINEDLSKRGTFALRLNAYEGLSLRIVSALAGLAYAAGSPEGRVPHREPITPQAIQ
jgi:hypothetical protein